jgi:hypothetical protein
MSLSEAVEVLSEFSRKEDKTGEGCHPPMTRREAMALQRLLQDAKITLEQISRGVIRRDRR